MGKLHTVSGFLYMVGWFVFLDGALLAQNEYGTPYKFVDALPGIFSSVGMILFAICDMKQIIGTDEESSFLMGGGGGFEGDENGPLKARIVFFIGAAMMLAGMTVSIWQLAAPWKQHPWCGWSMLTQTFISMIAAGFLAYGGAKSRTEEPAF